MNASIEDSAINGLIDWWEDIYTVQGKASVARKLNEANWERPLGRNGDPIIFSANPFDNHLRSIK